MTDANMRKPIVNTIKTLLHSNIIRVFIGCLVLGLYSIFLSPKVEGFVNQHLGNTIRNTSNTEINSLTPVFDIHVYASDYNLSSQITNNNTLSNTKFFTIDPRILAMNKFLSDYHSPMTPYAKTFIDVADQYGLDWRLVASISGVESAFGNITPANSHNGWGWRGVNANSAGWSMFSTWADGIATVTKGLANGYGTSLTPFEIEPAYCPPCAEGTAHAWANGVTNYMNELDYYVDNLDNL